MKLNKHEEAKLVGQGAIALGICLILAFGAHFVMYRKAAKLRLDAINLTAQNLQVGDENRAISKEIRFLKENEKAIETKWSTLKGWGSGVKPSNIGPLLAAGVDTKTMINSSRIPGNPTEYAGMRLSGDKTEFQRLLDGLTAVEKAQGLLQIKTATLSLPPNIEPNGEKPTFLRISLEVLAPSSK